jgi:hypothetical protein
MGHERPTASKFVEPQSGKSDVRPNLMARSINLQNCRGFVCLLSFYLVQKLHGSAGAWAVLAILLILI